MTRWKLAQVVVLLGSLSLVSSAVATSPINIFVATTGSDAAPNDGSIARPFRTIERARQAANSLKTLAANQNSPINVLLRAGRYALTDTLDFTPADSGNSPRARITYQAYCDPTVLSSGTSRLPFPYYQASSTSATVASSSSLSPPRLLWNGMGDPAAWTGPEDPFAQMGINKAGNSLLATSSSTTSSSQTNIDISNVCVDKTNPSANDPDGTDGLTFKNGHTCYANGPLATCVTGCMDACQSHLEHSDYPDAFIAKFQHLFGKDLSQHEDCVEVCTLSCRGCEDVELSGSVVLSPGTVTTWRLDRTLSSSLKVFSADLSSYLPSTPPVPAQPKDFASFTTLYINDVQLPRAGYPNCAVIDDSTPRWNRSKSLSCAFASVVAVDTPHSIKYNPSTFSSRVGAWSTSAAAMATTPGGVETHNDIIVAIRPNASEQGELHYSLAAVDTTANRLVLGGGGAELTYSLFDQGLYVSSSHPNVAFRVENVVDELDAPGEWYFDESTRKLFVIPLDTTSTVTTLTNSKIEIPWLHQLVRVSGSRANRIVAASHAHETLVETDSTSIVRHLRFRHLVFSGTQLHHLNVYERVPGSEWPMTRVAAVFLESVENVAVEHNTFAKIGGNALMISGSSSTVTVANNNISFIGGSGIAVLARRPPSLAGGPPEDLLLTRALNISFNQVHHVGKKIAHSAAIMVVGAQNAVLAGNLVFAVPSLSGAAYIVRNAAGASSEASTPLIRPTRSLLIAEVLPPVLRVERSTPTAISAPLSGFDIPLVAKLIGAPACDSDNYLGGGGNGRIDSTYNEPNAHLYTKFSGSCPTHANGAVLRVPERLSEPTHAQLLLLSSSATSASQILNTRRQIVVFPGQSLELAAVSSSVFRSSTDVFLGFHVETPNQVFELPLARSHWRIETRGCVFQDVSFEATCSGACGLSNDDASSPCGGPFGGLNSNDEATRWGMAACQAVTGGYEPDMATRVCVGPFEGWADCSGAGSPPISHSFYNCSIICRATTCL